VNCLVRPKVIPFLTTSKNEEPFPTLEKKNYCSVNKLSWNFYFQYIRSRRASICETARALNCGGMDDDQSWKTWQKKLNAGHKTWTQTGAMSIKQMLKVISLHFHHMYCFFIILKIYTIWFLLVPFILSLWTYPERPLFWIYVAGVEIYHQLTFFQCIYQFLTSNSNFKTTPNLQNSYFHKFY